MLCWTYRYCKYELFKPNNLYLYKKMIDPLTYFYKNIPFDIKKIKRLVTGRKYVMIELENQQIGVCATLNHQVDFQVNRNHNINLKNISHRIVYNAFLNATLNYLNKFEEEKDIFDRIDFDKYKKVVMIGYFGSLAEKFKKASIELTIFDKEDKGVNLPDMKYQIDSVKKADALILTSTTVFNNTFVDLVSSTHHCDTFMLGPSTILNRKMFEYPDINYIFGAIFNNCADELASIIEQGYGTKSFLHLMKKVYLKK